MQAEFDFGTSRSERRCYHCGAGLAPHQDVDRQPTCEACFASFARCACGALCTGSDGLCEACRDRSKPTTPTPFQAERKRRALARAERLERKTHAAFAAARAVTEHIPLGQPILVGHHSERRHRRALAKQDRLARKACAIARDADHARGAVALAGRAISNDDPDALPALRAKLENLERKRTLWKRINAAWRKGGADAVRALDLEEATITSIVETMRRCPWFDAPLSLTNLGAEIRRVRDRIAELEAGPPAFEPLAGAGWSIEALPDENRLAVRFAERQPRERCAELKRDGWRWSPNRGAWVRMLNASGIHRAHALAARLGRELGTP